ncbi:conserved hypothetical protein [Culex quinquefasciatus]|uniref:Uncharacterized protein n=1 Tax=Culex quinquefasciatus TaxID=7176 RepID=B0W0J5_CULQU|nr:conserved hypothetical protein [Culex quinquefasciatus]|eukprot:XP_001842229.1 conserved hypothetical protein [Culex quinquefasciatus]
MTLKPAGGPPGHGQPSASISGKALCQLFVYSYAQAGVLRAQSALGDNGHAANQQHNVAAQLSFFLQCNGESDTANWRCSESAELRLLSVIPNRDPFVR